MADSEDLVIVNALMRQALVSIEGVMGRNGLTAVLRTANLAQYIDHLPPDDLQPAVKSSDYARLNAAIEEFYGRGGRGMLHRIGKASFEYGLREQSALMGLAGVAVKLLPTRQRIPLLLNSVASALKKSNPQVRAAVEERDGHFAYVAHTCSVCFGRKSDKPTCHLYVGTLTEALRWGTGQNLQVRETQCLARGDGSCRFEVDGEGA
jgi:bacteriochlorophyll 4-vinyl reductase